MPVSVTGYVETIVFVAVSGSASLPECLCFCQVLRRSVSGHEEKAALVS